MERNFRVKEDTGTSPPNLDNDSSDFSLPHNQMQGPLSAAEWTDEKHSMYLRSMETSFVDHFYSSKEMLGCLSRIKNASSDPISVSGQFKVLRGGSWQKIRFVRENPHMSRLNECRDLKGNPWIQHYRSSGKQGSLAAPVVEEIVTPTSQVVDLGQRMRFPSVSAGQLHFSHLSEPHVFRQDLMCSDTEMSDQNFADEKVEGERENNNKRNMKRLKLSS